MSHLIFGQQHLNWFKKMHFGYFCGTVPRLIFVIWQASTGEMDTHTSSNFDFVNPCVHRFSFWEVIYICFKLFDIDIVFVVDFINYI